MLPSAGNEAQQMVTAAKTTDRKPTAMVPSDRRATDGEKRHTFEKLYSLFSC